MNGKRLPPDDPHEWLNRAWSNLLRAKHLLEGVYLEDLCFDAQQAAEKAVKAVLIYLGVRFPRTHDLAELLTLVEKAGQPVPERIRRASILMPYAVESRYPGLSEPVSREEYEEAVAIAEEVVRWAEEVVRRGKEDP
ncbi:MAG: HEPN domain-containing protein [Candidatus Caldatribacteriaceae bacterium]